MIRIVLSALLLLAHFASPLPAKAAGTPPDSSNPHNIEAGTVGESIDLSQHWLFHPDDTHDYSGPDFEDRSWPVISADQTFDAYAPAGTRGGWYRVHVHLPANEPSLAVSIENFRGSFQLFANGVALGGFGSMQGDGEDLQARFANFALPPRLAGSRDLVLVIHSKLGHIRALQPDHRVGLSRQCVIRLGQIDTFYRDRNLFFTQERLENAVVLTAWTAVLLLAGGLFFELRNHSEFLAVAMEAAALVSWNVINIYCAEHNIAYSHPLNLLSVCLSGVEFVAELEFLRLLVGMTRTRLLLFVEILALSRYVALVGTELLLLPTAFVPWMSLIFTIAVSGAELSLLVIGVRRKNKDALMLLPPYVLFACTDLWNRTMQIWELIGLPGVPPAIPRTDLPYLHLSLHDFENGFLVLDILAVLILRTLRLVREQSAVAAEIKAAQTMQRLLLARASAPTPAFHVDSVYHPASEVGGDFFLVSPGPDRSLTAIVGDVSGKGLIAAMRVSMILGVLRREDSHDPLTIVNQLNRALLNESGEGFTTVCCVSLDHDGQYTIVNAGHIAPFIVGGAASQSVEVLTPSALPLGLTADPGYESLSGTLNFAERMILMSDGVVEARSTKGELYGFDRLSTLVHLPAGEIASAAQAFGQEDDITVLSIACA